MGRSGRIAPCNAMNLAAATHQLRADKALGTQIGKATSDQLADAHRCPEPGDSVGLTPGTDAQRLVGIILCSQGLPCEARPWRAKQGL